jgi:hypothetical protein
MLGWRGLHERARSLGPVLVTQIFMKLGLRDEPDLLLRLRAVLAVRSQ